jgi:hypothetical protein
MIKTDPALLRPSNLSNEIKKRVPKSRDTIPLNSANRHSNRVGLGWGTGGGKGVNNRYLLMSHSYQWRQNALPWQNKILFSSALLLFPKEIFPKIFNPGSYCL